jgi:AcrR family transcriptional regulator
VRTHGWGGDPPTGDGEAVERIVAAAAACVDERGARADVAQVAERLGVTRQTVYRYFPTRDALFSATAGRAAGPFVERLAAHVAPIDDPAEALVEAVLFCLRELPVDRQLSVLFAPGRIGPSMTGPRALDFARHVLRRLPIDLAALPGDDVDRLAEHLLRLLQSLLLDPGTVARDPVDLRRFLELCLVPAVTGAGARSGDGRG